MNSKSKRLLSLDILRGITIAGMILVNNPGSWRHVYAPLRHASWHGLTPTDLVFPFFMFIMGVTTFISLRKTEFKPSKSALLSILKRTCVIFVIGLGLSWVGVSMGAYQRLAGEDIGFFQRFATSITSFENIRILGVMQRLALSYGGAALIAIFVKHKYIPHIIIGSLVGYFLILIFGHGFEQGDHSILAVVDQMILGRSHMYYDSGIDPEGVLSTIPAIAHVLIGFMCGKLIFGTQDNNKRMLDLFIIGAILFFAGALLSYGCPINKKIWSPTFVLTTCGMGATLLALLIWIIDVKGYKKWSMPFESFGINPLFIYVFAELLSTISGRIRVTVDGTVMSVKGWLYNEVLAPPLGDYFGSFVFALIFVTITWLVGYLLYRKRIYIKI